MRGTPQRETPHRFTTLSSAKTSYCVPPTVTALMRIVGMPTPTGTPWPFLPQVPTPVSSAKSLPTMLMRVNTSGPVADQAGALHRPRDLAVLDQIRLVGRKDELAVGDVHLPAAKRHRVEPRFDRAR